MRTILFAAAVLCCMAAGVWAQPAPPPSPAILALLSKLQDEIDYSLRCGTEKFTALAQIQSLNQKIIKLEADLAAATGEKLPDPPSK